MHLAPARAHYRPSGGQTRSPLYHPRRALADARLVSPHGAHRGAPRGVNHRSHPHGPWRTKRTRLQPDPNLRHRPRRPQPANMVYMFCYFVGGGLGSYGGALCWHAAAWPGVRRFRRRHACPRARGRICVISAAGTLTDDRSPDLRDIDSFYGSVGWQFDEPDRNGRRHVRSPQRQRPARARPTSTAELSSSMADSPRLLQPQWQMGRRWPGETIFSAMKQRRTA